jgi:hypothetical protein
VVHAPSFGSPRAVHTQADGRTVDVLLLRRAAVAEVRHPSWLGEQISVATFDILALEEAWPHPSATVGPASLEAERFLALLKSAKIVLTDSSARRYWVTELSHAFNAQALVISDEVGENRRLLQTFGVEVKAMDYETPGGRATIASTVRYWLEHATERLAKVQAGFDYSTRNLGD